MKDSAIRPVEVLGMEPIRIDGGPCANAEKRTLSIIISFTCNLGFQILASLGPGFGFKGRIIVVQTVLPLKRIRMAISGASLFMTLGGALFVPISQALLHRGIPHGNYDNAPELDGNAFLCAGATEIRSLLVSMGQEVSLESVLKASCRWFGEHLLGSCSLRTHGFPCCIRLVLEKYQERPIGGVERSCEYLRIDDPECNIRKDQLSQLFVVGDLFRTNPKVSCAHLIESQWMKESMR